eukprot:Skav217892  [mRNA]  locus=scaffold67:368067:377389:+ [translate_table: standard]
MEITPQDFPWAFKEGDPKKRIAVLERFATLILCHSILDHQGQASSHVRLPVGSDNQGNVFALLNMASKKPRTAILLMELILTLHISGSSLAPSHVPRELNQWADELTHTDYVGFNSSLRVDVKAYLAKLLLVPRLQPDGQVDFTDSSTQNPGTGFGGLSCKLPVVNFAAGGVATPADAALCMQLGVDGVFVGSGIFKSSDPAKRARAIVKAVTHYNDPAVIAEVSEDLGEAMTGINCDGLVTRFADREGGNMPAAKKPRMESYGDQKQGLAGTAF